MSTENEKIKYLVADTTAFINAVPLNVSKYMGYRVFSMKRVL